MKARFFLIVTGLVFLYLLWAKLELGLLRYFDADEFAYLHWAHNVASGKVPYKDFLLYVPPGFLYVLSLLFSFFQGTAILTAGRVFAWTIFVGIGIALGMILVLLRGDGGNKGYWGHWGKFFLPGIVLSFLPLPADKFLEIRPDNLALLVGLIGLVCHMRKKPLWAGVAYGTSLLILPKALPQVIVGVVVSPSLLLVAGIGLPLLLFGVWVSIFSDFGSIWYALTKLPVEINRIAEIFPILRWQFFYHNATYYGLPGVNIALVANHVVWLVGLTGGVVRLVTPWLGAKKNELLVAGSFFAYILAFMYVYPMRHAQYLIPIAAFVALYAADVLRSVGLIGLVGVLGAMMYVSVAVTTLKLAWTNRDDYKTLEAVLATIPKGTYVFDLTVATIYYQDPYYVSAVPFGQWEPYLSRPLPNLGEALTATNTRYIYQGRLERVQTLTQADQAYINAHFAPLAGNPSMLVRKQ